MDPWTFKKYNVLKKDIPVYKTIWSIKNNNERNAYINNLYVCLNNEEPYIVNQYYTFNASVGMPNVLNIITAYVYFNHYHYHFDIHLFKNNKFLSRHYTLTPTLKSNTKLYQHCIKYNNQLKQLLYFYIFKLAFPKDVTFYIASYLMVGEPHQISPNTESRSTSGGCGHSRNIRI